MQEIFSWACFNPTAMMHICHCSLAVGIRKNFRNRSYFGNFDSREVSRFSRNPPIPLLNPKTSQHVGRFLLFLPFIITLPDNTHGNRHFPVILVPFRFSLWPSSKVNLQVLFSFFVWLWILTQSFSRDTRDCPGTVGLTRVPGLPIRNCTGSSNNLAPRGIKVRAWMWQQRHSLSVCLWSHVEEQLGRFVTMPSAPTSPPLSLRLFLDFRAMSFPEWPFNCFVSTIHHVIWPSPGTLLPTYLNRWWTAFPQISHNFSRQKRLHK